MGRNSQILSWLLIILVAIAATLLLHVLAALAWWLAVTLGILIGIFGTILIALLAGVATAAIQHKRSKPR